MQDPTKLPLFSRNLGVCCAGVMRGSDGSATIHRNGAPLKGTIKLNPEMKERRESEDVAPTYYLELFVKIEGTPDYTVRINVDDFNNPKLFMQAMAAKLPAGVQFTEALHDSILCISLEPELCPTYDASFYEGADGGLYCDGKQHSSAAFTIVDEIRTPDNSPAYILRNAEGKRTPPVSVESLQNGSYSNFLGQNIGLRDPLGLSICLRKAWNDRTPAERQAFDNELLQAKQAEVTRQHNEIMARERDAKWGPLAAYLGRTL